MAPQAENEKMCSTKTQKKKIQDEILQKLKLDEEKEKKKLEKEAKRRAEIEKIKNESFIRQADLLVPLKKEKQTVQPKKGVPNSQSKTSKQKKQRFHSLENSNNQGFSYEFNSKPGTSAWNKKQPTKSEGRFRCDSSSSENSLKRYEENCWSYSRNASVSDSVWNNINEHFPMLGAEAPVPAANVWEERKYKQEEIQALQPQNEYDEEAMLQQALALSLMEATQEEERKQKLEEEYKLQMKVLEHNPKVLDNFKELDELAVSNKSEDDSFRAIESVEQQSHSQKFSRNAALSSIIQKSKSSSSGGARPKLNKIIDNFGGWGLKDNKIESSNSLSNFTNDIDEKSSKKAWKHDNHLPVFQKGVFNNAKKSENVNNLKVFDNEIKTHVLDSWSNDFSNGIKETPASDLWENQDLSDEKEVTFDDNEVSLSHLNSTTVCFDSSKENECFKDKRSDNMSSIWLNSEDEPAKVSNQWDNVLPSEKPNGATNKNRNSARYISNSFANDTQTNCDNAKGSLSNFKTDETVKDHEPAKYSNKEHDSLNVLMKSSTANDVSVGSYIKKEKELSNSNIFSQIENKYSYPVGDTSKLNDVSSAAETFLSSDDSWSDKSPNKSTDSNSVFLNQNILQTELSEKEAPFKFGTVEESSTVKELISNKEIDTSIFPPHPAPAVPEADDLNQAMTAEISGDKCSKELPPIQPPQAPPQMPSQYLFNPAMLPGINPMLGLGMDALTARQMLMLSNPFFASQLLVMEQYYRTLGIPLDLFSFPTQPVPNMLFPGVVNTSEQNIPNPINVNVSPTHNFHQNQYQEQSVLSKNMDSISSEKYSTVSPSGLDKNVSDIEENLWYASLLSTDSDSVIPPPKPVSNTDQIPSTSQPSETAENASNFIHNLNSKDYLSTNQGSNLLEGESHKSITAVQAPMLNTEVSGWGDLDNENFHNDKSKTNSWDDDYGWGSESLPAKSAKNPSRFEDKKVVHRQPTRQPQLSRFQRSRRFN